MTEENGARTIAMDMIHSEEEIKHALSHLLGTACDDDGHQSSWLQGHETMTLYRNVRKKYVPEDYWKEHQFKDGPRQVCTFRSIDRGLMAAYQAGCCPILERPASVMYVNVNPRDVAAALQSTHDRYCRWVEHKAGRTTEQVRKGNRADFAGTLDVAFQMQVSHHESKQQFSVIDVDDNNPDTWLKRIRDAIGDDAIEMIIDTKNGFHVVYRPTKMPSEAHVRLTEVLESDTGKGKDEKVTKLGGCAVSCPLPGGYQADHKTRIIHCSCATVLKTKSEPNLSDLKL